MGFLISVQAYFFHKNLGQRAAVYGKQIGGSRLMVAHWPVCFLLPAERNLYDEP